MSRIEVTEIETRAQKSSSMLAEVRDVYNHGTTLNSVAGDVHYHSYSVASNQSPSLNVPSSSVNQYELPSQLYSRLMMREGRGYPLLDAKLPNELPSEYQSHGVMIGDVGIVAQDGYFDVLFNICEPAHGSINGGYVPDGFIQLERPPDDRHNYRRGQSYKPSQSAVTDSVQIVSYPATTDSHLGTYEFQCGPGEGAVLALPHGASKEDLIHRKEFLDYATRHGVSWYEFANGRLGRDVPNGSIYLITGYDKACSWGTAAFFHTTTTPSFGMSFDGAAWNQPGRAFAKEGPTFAANSPLPENQCIFLRGYKVTLSTRILTRLFGVTVVETSPMDDIPQETGSWTLISLLSGSFATILGHTARENVPSPSAPHFRRSLGPSDEQHTVLESMVPQLSTEIHPSNLINLYLLNKFPESDLAVSHDDIWCSYFEEQAKSGARNLPSIVDYLATNYSVKCEGGGYLRVVPDVNKESLMSIPGAAYIEDTLQPLEADQHMGRSPPDMPAASEWESTPEATDSLSEHHSRSVRRFSGPSNRGRVLHQTSSLRPDPAHTLTSLPSELIVSILSTCDPTSIIECDHVCSLFHKLISSTTILQLNKELHLSGQQLGTTMTSNRPEQLLGELKAYNKAWRELSFVEENPIVMSDGSLWELYGDTLAFTDARQSITCHRLPSPLKGLGHEQWTISDFGIALREFAMDPAQDLLVLIENPGMNAAHRLHLRTLSSGKPHPSASAPVLTLFQNDLVPFASYEIEVSGAHIGVLVRPGGLDAPLQNVLYVWEWRLGTCEMRLIGNDIQSFLFFDERHLILGIHTAGVLLVDFLREPAGEHITGEVRHGCKFLLPSLHQDAHSAYLEIRADSAPDWTSSAQSQTPFYTANRSRTYALTLTASQEHEERHLTFLIPHSTIHKYMNDLPPGHRSIPSFSWEEWGPMGSRCLDTTLVYDPTWIRFMSGTKYVTLKESPDHQTMVQVFDLNPYFRTSRSLNFNRSDTTKTPPGYVFDEEVATTYPYHVRETIIPDLTWDDDLTVVCSDNCILVVNPSCRHIRVFAF